MYVARRDVKAVFDNDSAYMMQIKELIAILAQKKQTGMYVSICKTTYMFFTPCATFSTHTTRGHTQAQQSARTTLKS
jgi:hypothetical protein